MYFIGIQICNSQRIFFTIKYHYDFLLQRHENCKYSYRKNVFDMYLKDDTVYSYHIEQQSYCEKGFVHLYKISR